MVRRSLGLGPAPPRLVTAPSHRFSTSRLDSSDDQNVTSLQAPSLLEPSTNLARVNVTSATAQKQQAEA